jgi:hypothetical protein
LEDVPNVGKAGDIKEVVDIAGATICFQNSGLVSKPGAVTQVKAQIEARAKAILKWR